MEGKNIFVPRYNKADRDHMRQFLQKASPIIDLIASGQVPWGSSLSAELADALAEKLDYEHEKEMDDDALRELREDRQVLINLYGAAKKKPDLPELYGQLSILLRKYGLFDEEVVLLENAVADGGLSDKNLISVKDRLCDARRYQEADDAELSESERNTENLRRALRKKPLDKAAIEAGLSLCSDDAVLYEIACNTDRDPDMVSIREKAARMIRSRDYRYALSSHPQYKARTAMILNLYDSLDGDDLFIARTILTDPKDANKVHMLLFCKDESLLMLGWKYVYGVRRFCARRLHDMGSGFPEAYMEMTPQDKTRCEQEWLAHASELALNLLSEDKAINDRLSGSASVDSEPLHFFLSFHYPGLAVRWWHARKLKNPGRIFYAGSWTSDDKIKEYLSAKVSNSLVITELVNGDYSGADLVFAFRKPEDLTLQDRFLIEIMKNNPDPAIREHVRKELLKANVEIHGTDLTKPDPLYNK